jgi:hypothetical protein
MLPFFIHASLHLLPFLTRMLHYYLFFYQP